MELFLTKVKLIQPKFYIDNELTKTFENEVLSKPEIIQAQAERQLAKRADDDFRVSKDFFKSFLVCGICFEDLDTEDRKKILSCTVCSRNLCQICSEQVKRDRCFHCRQLFNFVQLPLSMLEILQNTRFECNYCKLVLRSPTYKSHFTFSANACSHILIDCPNTCQVGFPLKEIKAHIASCKLTKFHCSTCYKTTQFEFLDQHSCLTELNLRLRNSLSSIANWL